MYADDMILLAPSVTELNNMVTICCDELQAINLKLNTQKYCCLRTGKSHFINCSNIPTIHGHIPWAKEVKYLGLTLISGCRFKISFANTKCKFYSCFNELYSKMGRALDLSVIVHLLQTIAMPILLYSLESLHLNKSEINSLEFTLSRALYKIFKVSGTENIKFCMKAYGIDGINECIVKKSSAFLHKFGNIVNVNINNLFLGLNLSSR